MVEPHICEACAHRNHPRCKGQGCVCAEENHDPDYGDPFIRRLVREALA